MKTLKNLAIFCLGAMLFASCTPSGGDDGGSTSSGLKLSATPTTIYDDGVSYAQLSVTLHGKPLTEGYVIYDAVTNKPVTLEDLRFTATAKGSYSFWASYGTLQSNTISILVVETPPAALDAPEDNDPTNTDFKRRVLLTQFTGTGCGYCPNMMNALYLVNQQIGDDIVIAAAHLFNEDDPMYLFEDPTLDNSLGVNTYPDIVADLKKNTGDTYPTTQYVTSMVNNAFSRVGVKGGMAVNAKDYTKDGRNFINATVLVKAKEKAEFRVGVWLVEDNISAGQANNGIAAVEGVNFGVHHNAIRKANSRQTNMDFTGLTLGEIEAGETASQEFSFQIKEGWNPANMRLIVFISTKEGNNWYVNNAMSAATDGVTGFDYN